MSKRIKKRRKLLRLGTPLGFSLFCVLILLLLAGAYIGVSWSLEHAPTVFEAVKRAVRDEVEVVSTTPAPLTPEELEQDEKVQTGLMSYGNTPAVGTPDTSTPTPAPTPILTPEPTPFFSKPLKGKIVGIDPVYDSASEFPEEAEFNLAFAMELKAYLEEREVIVVMTRTDASPCSDEDRYNAINAGNCDIAVRLQCNEAKSSVSGCYVRSSRKNMNFGQTLSSAYRKATGLKSQSGKTGGYEIQSDEVCKNSSCPVGVLIMGNFTGKKDGERMNDPDFRESMIRGIYNGLMKYYGVEETSEPTPTPKPTKQP